MRPPSRRYLVSKRILDIVVSFTALILAAPILLACALAIRLETPGPVMFAQKRTGRGGRRFPMWKFRTMVANAEELKAELAHLNILPPPDFKIPNDPRVTKVGKFLRATSLDELPQLLNVLRGDMSIVGPRPTSFPASSYELWHTQRLDVAPGMTGLWQLEGRNATTFDERLRLDVKYIRHMSLGQDLRLMARTVGAVVRRDGA
ncbi:MAG TPA: sugar transferase [Solirubrobacteraceae bacterium]|jgi:lipopolysaccharide/colanic/teichoic acid biosynthesis glycosyltransferase|nr:sugar transferase [Solirubrobacteraceae bacterium]